MRERKETKRIIVHHSLSDRGNVRLIRNWHLDKGWEDIGYHFVITPAGFVEIGRHINNVGAHAKGRNDDSLGVCFVGDYRKYPPSLCQIKAFILLYHYLADEFMGRLPIEAHRIKTNPCPGEQFPLDYLINLTKGTI